MAEHDYSGANRRWGHDYHFSPVLGGQRGKAHGWGDGLRRGDLLILDHPDGGTTCYRIDTIRYETDPPDMWWAELTFAPRLNNG